MSAYLFVTLLKS